MFCWIVSLSLRTIPAVIRDSVAADTKLYERLVSGCTSFSKDWVCNTRHLHLKSCSVGSIQHTEAYRFFLFWRGPPRIRVPCGALEQNGCSRIQGWCRWQNGRGSSWNFRAGYTIHYNWALRVGGHFTCWTHRTTGRSCYFQGVTIVRAHDSLRGDWND